MGLISNFLAMVLNHGWIPISPETVQKLALTVLPVSWQVGYRLGYSKDIVLPVGETRLWYLPDCLLLPSWIPYRMAFSLGDILIALGVFWVLWAAVDLKWKSKEVTL